MESANKTYVKERMAGLESGEVASRGPGRPRIHPEGYTHSKPKKESVDPEISEARAAAGRAGAASRKRVEIQEQLRRKAGKEVEAELDQLRVEEQVTDEQRILHIQAQASRCFDKSVIVPPFDWNKFEFIQQTGHVLLDISYNRKKYPDQDFDYDQHLLPQGQQEYLTWPDLTCLELCRVMTEDFRLSDGLRKLAIRTFETYLDWAEKQEFPLADATLIKNTLTRLKSAEDVFIGKPEKPKELLKSVEEQLAERGNSIVMTGIESASIGLTQATLRAAAERQEREEQARAEERERDRILREAREREQEQLRQIAPDAFEFLRRGR